MQCHKNQTPRYLLRKGLDAWDLIFNGPPAVLKHEQGVSYIAYLLLNPPAEPVHAVDLIANVGETVSPDPSSGSLRGSGLVSPVDKRSRIQERALSLDDLSTLRALRRKEQELEAILDNDDEQEPIKMEALRQLEQIAIHQRRHARRSEDNAQKAVRAVRRALIRFHSRIVKSTNVAGHPHPVLIPFAQHLELYLLVPSARYSGKRGGLARQGRTGCFTYEPPPGVVWQQ